MANRKELLMELDRALATKATLKQQHTDMIRHIARSPKKKPVPANSAVSERPPPSQREEQQPQLQPQAARSIPAYRPGGSPTDSRDTLDKEIDAAIAKNVVNMLQTPAVRPHIVLAPDDTRVSQPVQQVGGTSRPVAASPAFMTTKRRNMHCELDTPGTSVPYPHARGPQRGLFARLFSCFLPPPPVTSSRLLNDENSYGAELQRPSSAKLSPPKLTLAGEMAPLRRSLASLAPGLGAAALGDPDDNPPSPREAEALLRRSLARSIAAEVAANPPTPRFGGMPHSRLNASELALTSSLPDLEREASFQSLDVLASEADFDTPQTSSLRRTPMAGSGGRPRRRRTLGSGGSPVNFSGLDAASVDSPGGKAPSSLQQPVILVSHPQNLDVLGARVAQMMTGAVPLPPPVIPMPLHEVKQTQVRLSALLRPSALSAEGRCDEESQPVRGRQAERATYTTARTAAPPPRGILKKSRETHQDQAIQTRSKKDSVSKEPRSDTRRVPLGVGSFGRSSGASRSAPTSPYKSARNEVGMNDFDVDIVQDMDFAMYIRSAPGSRTVSPLREPRIQPRMTKASAARSEATQRLLKRRREREAAQLESIRAHTLAVHVDKGRKRHDEPSIANTNEVFHTDAIDTWPNNDYQPNASAGYLLPPAADARLVKIQNSKEMDAGKVVVPVEQKRRRHRSHRHNENMLMCGEDTEPVPPRSPSFYQMLHRLAMGMSVDKEKVRNAMQPSPLPICFDDLVEGTGVSPQAMTENPKEEKGPERVLANGAAEEDGDRKHAVPKEKARHVDPMTAVVHDDAYAKGEGSAGVHPAVDVSSNTLLGQLLDMERSLTLDDLAALRLAIRREGRAVEDV